MYKIVYSSRAKKKDLPLIPEPYKENIQKNIYKKLSIDPYKFGEPLCGDLKGKWKLRVGKYRVIYKIVDQEVTVLILEINVRGDVY